MSQVVAMLNYGEMQILENFKNTLLYRLYSTLINVNNLRDAIDLAKRVLTTEKLDRQLTGQSSTPFMKATSSGDSHLPQNHQKKGVTFDTMETTDKTPNGLLEIEVRVGIEMRIMILEVGVEIEIIGEEKNPGLDPTPG